MTAVVQPDTGELTVLMSKDEALATTAKIKSYMGVLCQLVKEAHDKQAWRALGYGSWAAYCKAEFDYSRSYSYRLIGHVNRILELSAAAGIEADVSPMGDTLTERATRDLDMPEAVEAVTEAVADLPADATDKAKAEAATAGIAAARARREAEALKPPEPEPIACSVEDCIGHAVGDLGFCPWHHGKFLADVERRTAEAEAAQNDGADEGAHDPGQNDNTSPVVDADPKDGGGQAEPQPAPTAVTPSLPCTWRNDLANACYLTRLPFDLVADAATPDDIADLTALTDWCFQFIQAITDQEQTA